MSISFVAAALRDDFAAFDFLLVINEREEEEEEGAFEEEEEGGAEQQRSKAQRISFCGVVELYPFAIRIRPLFRPFGSTVPSVM